MPVCCRNTAAAWCARLLDEGLVLTASLWLGAVQVVPPPPPLCKPNRASGASKCVLKTLWLCGVGTAVAVPDGGTQCVEVALSKCYKRLYTLRGLCDAHSATTIPPMGRATLPLPLLQDLRSLPRALHCSALEPNDYWSCAASRTARRGPLKNDNVNLEHPRSSTAVGMSVPDFTETRSTLHNVAGDAILSCVAPRCASRWLRTTGAKRFLNELPRSRENGAHEPKAAAQPERSGATLCAST